MKLVRRRLFACAIAVIACQTMGVAASQLAYYVASPPTVHAVVCTCSHGSSSECPMHKNPTSAPGPRFCPGHDASLDIVLTSLLGLAGLAADGEQSVGSHQPHGRVPNLVAAAIDRSTPPTSPPPRA